MTQHLSATDRQRVGELPLLADLPRAAREGVLDATAAGSWSPGQPVIRQGDVGRELFVVLEGSARVTVRSGGRDVFLADLGPGDVFGEEGLLTGAARTAAVTAHASLRCAIVPAAALDLHLAGDRSVRGGLERLSTRRFHERLARSVAALHGLELDGTERADVARVSFPPGACILEQGQPSEAVFFVLAGVAVALRECAGAPEVLARVGPGQCVGEVGVLRRAPRAASVRAETEVEALRVEAGRFRAWVSGNPRLADYLGTLERIYPLTDGRLLSVYRSEHEGREAVTTLAGDPAGECVLSTKVLGEDTVLLARGSTEREGERDVVRHARAQDGRERELLLDCVERGRRGELRRARICGVQVRGVDVDVPRLYRALCARELIDGRELERFRRSGFLGGRTPVVDPDSVCSCLGIGRRELSSALAEHGPELKAVVAVLGLGAVCGACLPRARELASGSLPLRLDPTVADREERARVGSRLVAHRLDVDFDADALMRLSAEPEIQVLAVASLFAPVGERLMVQCIGEALPAVEDPLLVADAEVFLQQESLHITTHEPLNTLFMERIYPGSRALRRCNLRMVGGAERLSSRTALAVSAAFEHIADCAFASFFQEYYRNGRRFNSEPAVHELVERSGVGALFLWHGGEELAHRHVAFDTLRASGAGWLTRVVGFGFLGLQAVFLLIPALVSLRVHTRGRPRASAAPRSGGGLKLALWTIYRGLRFLRPGFHPSRERYPFLAELAGDLEQFPEA